MGDLTGLQSEDQKILFDIIDRLRAKGLSEYVNLPQIIVCGDQSAGKSSVLEAISGMTFPTKDNLCTRFATELVLRQQENPKPHASATIIPCHDRSQQERDQLKRFQKDIDLNTLNLGDVIEEAKEWMGLTDTKVFSSDTLRVELCGPDQPNLTLVDLPGLFRAGNKDQSVQDASTVRNMVHGYMERPRSIILAVVSAKNDFALQEVTELARELDPNGQRTLGLITKPDTLDLGSDSEASYIRLAQNQDVAFRLGWHVLKNRSYDMRLASSAERDSAEALFFSQGNWKDLDPVQLGVESLKPRLSQVLRDQILQQLPGLILDVESGIAEFKNQLTVLGPSRLSIDEQKLYLLQASQKFSSLMKSALDGAYDDAFFGLTKSTNGYAKRIRAVIQNSLTEFERQLRLKGQTVNIIDNPPSDRELKATEISRSAYIDQVKDLLRKNRGRELPGTFNPLIIGELFAEQCRPWRNLTKEANNIIFRAVMTTVQLILEHILVKETAEKILRIVQAGIEQLQGNVEKKTNELLLAHEAGHPITYNHYLTDTVEKVQAGRRYNNLEATLKKVLGHELNKSYSIVPSNLLSYLAKNLEVDMQRYGSDTAVDYMQSYYKVAQKRFVDDISVLAIEECLVRHLPSLFTHEMIYNMKNEEIANLAEESKQLTWERSLCLEKLNVFEACWHDLRQLDKYSFQTEIRKCFESSNGDAYYDITQPSEIQTPPSVCGSLVENDTETTEFLKSLTSDEKVLKEDEPLLSAKTMRDKKKKLRLR